MSQTSVKNPRTEKSPPSKQPSATQDQQHAPAPSMDAELSLQRKLGNQSMQHLQRSAIKQNNDPSETQNRSDPRTILDHSSGKTLDARSRNYFEPRIGFKLNNVRIHNNEASHALAKNFRAHAFTVGEHIGFAQGVYSQHTQTGRRVLAHELTHVKQTYEQRSQTNNANSLEHEAYHASAMAEPTWQRRLPILQTPSVVNAGQVHLLSITLNTGNQITDTAPGGFDNMREDVLALLDRLHTLWSISNNDYSNQYTYVSMLLPYSQVPQRDAAPTAAMTAAGVATPWSFQPTIDAIRRNQHASLAGPVIQRYMGLRVTDSVGRGSRNLREDVLAVMNRLNFLFNYTGFSAEKAAVTALSGGSTVAESSISATLRATVRLKTELAQGTMGINPRRADETEFGNADRFAAQSSIVSGNTVNYIPAGQSNRIPFTKQFSVFIPSGADVNRNKVHLFFTPFTFPEEFVAQQGLRRAHNPTEWILIGVPALGEHDNPNFITISTAEIQRCLSAAGRNTNIDAIRMSAHSRGYRGLINTMGRTAGPPLIDLSRVERVSIFDASYRTLGSTLRARQSSLTRMQDPANSRRFASDAIQLFDVIEANVSGLPGLRINSTQVRGLSYVRLVQDGLARHDINHSSFSLLTSATRAATLRLLASIPSRGRFSMRNPTPTGKVDLISFLTTHNSDLRIVDDASDGLKPFITASSLDNGAGYDRRIDAHHWFVAELVGNTID